LHFTFPEGNFKILGSQASERGTFPTDWCGRVVVESLFILPLQESFLLVKQPHSPSFFLFSFLFADPRQTRIGEPNHFPNSLSERLMALAGMLPLPGFSLDGFPIAT
jgi:hypothetical protein